MKRERGTFRKLALRAKERLSGNFWREVNGAKIIEINRAKLEGKTSGEVITRFMNHVKTNVVRVQELDPSEELFYSRIKEVLSSGNNQNPLAAVLDRNLLKELGDAERERYVFKLSEKVKSCIERFEQEKTFAVLNCQ